MILADLSLEGTSLAAGQLAKICLKAFGGSNRSYMNLLRRLEKRGLITVELEGSEDKAQWVPKLTAAGVSATVNQSPQAAWQQTWNGKWTMLTFDLPTYATKERGQLRRWLKKLRFGMLQGSVWISHRPLSEIETSFAEMELSPNSVIAMEGEFWSKANNELYVEKAWQLDKMQSAYSDYLAFLDKNPIRDKTLPTYKSWRIREKAVWETATAADPLLPEELWPKKRAQQNRALEAEARRKQALATWLTSAANW